MAFKIEKDTCIDCGLCREVCPLDAVVHSWGFVTAYRILVDRCTECGGVSSAPCIRYCPVDDCIITIAKDE
jgi:ferredoxin